MVRFCGLNLYSGKHFVVASFVWRCFQGAGEMGGEGGGVAAEFVGGGGFVVAGAEHGADDGEPRGGVAIAADGAEGGRGIGAEAVGIGFDEAAAEEIADERVADGFEIAEADLRLRGPGDVMGTMQSGISDLKFADFLVDTALLREARRLADEVLAEDPSLEGPHRGLRRLIAEGGPVLPGGA